MIGISALKTKPDEAGQTVYNFKEPQGLSRVPLYLVGLLSAVVIYLRSAFPDLRWPVQAHEPDPAPPGDPDQPLATQIVDIGPRRPDPVDEPEPQPPDEDHDVEPPRDRGSNVVPFPVTNVTLIDSPPIDFIPLPKIEEADAASQDTSTAGLPRTGGSGQGGERQALAPVAAASEQDRRNRAPEASGILRLNEAVAGAVLLIGFDELLAREVDPDGDTVTIGKIQVSEGSMAVTPEGLVYSSNAAALPKDVKVTYEVTDGVATVVRTAVIPLVRGPLLGTPDNDVLAGSLLGDMIDGLAGNDLIDGRAGNDVIMGGDGDDHIVAGDGDDVVLAGAGDDVVFGGAGNDTLSGGDGNDHLEGEAGDDVLAGEAGNDELHGGSGDDVVDGGTGDDLLSDGEGADRVFGGDGADTVMVAMDQADDIFVGGDGNDILDLSAATMDLAIDLEQGSMSSEEAGTDSVAGFEMVIGGSGNDVFTIGGEAVELTGGDGEDRFIFKLPEGVDKPTLIHDILDFVAGDHINVSRFEFTTEAEEEKVDRFGTYYRDRDDPEQADAMELRIRHRTDAEDGEMTIFEFDGDGDFEFEMTIEVHGHHQPYLYESATA